jgi:glycosyltransferase involved in cell wall biosynthesis
VSGVTVSAVLGSYNRAWFLRRAIASLRRELGGIPHEILVVDGGSTDGSVRWLARQRDVVLILQHNRGAWRGRPLERRTWGGFMNLAFKAARGRYVLMVSDDTLLDAGAVAAGLRAFDEAAAAGRKPGAMAFPWLEWPTQQRLWVRKVFGQVYVNHGLFLRAALEEVGWIDEAFGFTCGDGDLCLRLRERGYEVGVAEGARVLHNFHANTFLRAGNDLLGPADTRRLLEKWAHAFPGAGKKDIVQWEYQPGAISPGVLAVFEQRWRSPSFLAYAVPTYGRAWWAHVSRRRERDPAGAAGQTRAV